MKSNFVEYESMKIKNLEKFATVTRTRHQSTTGRSGISVRINVPGFADLQPACPNLFTRRRLRRASLSEILTQPRPILVKFCPIRGPGSGGIMGGPRLLKPASRNTRIASWGAYFYGTMFGHIMMPRIDSRPNQENPNSR